MNPATAAAMNPHCHPAAATMNPVIIIDTALPSCGVEEKMLYIVPRVASGNHRDRLMVPGGEPIDCIQPFTPHNTENSTSINTDPNPSVPCSSPSAPRTRFRTAEIPIPAAMNRRMLQ